MKRLLFLMAACMLMAACGRTSTKRVAAEPDAVPAEDCVEVLYFHTKQRCATCMAIERLTRETLEEHFADALAEGALVFRSIDITEAGNEAIADRYEASWSSLFVTEWQGGQPQSENLTAFAFANARTAPETFRKGLADTIASRLR